MNTTLTATTISVCLLGAVAIGMLLRRLLPPDHLSTDSKESVKLAMGLVATMSALLLGLMVSSAKGAYDAMRAQVIEMAAKSVFLDRVLALYGPETADARAQFRTTIEEGVRIIWKARQSPQAGFAANPQAGSGVYFAIDRLSPRDETQRALKAKATAAALELGQLRALLMAESIASISKPLLFMVVCWLVVIFLGFSVLSPPNATTTLALALSALSVSGAIFLIMELDRPFGGLIQISSEPMTNALGQIGR